MKGTVKIVVWGVQYVFNRITSVLITLPALFKIFYKQTVDKSKSKIIDRVYIVALSILK